MFENSIPKVWCVTSIDEVAEVKGGKRLPKGKKFTSEPTPFPYIRVTDFCNGSIDTSELKYIDEGTRETIRNYTISSEDLYISIAGTIGLVGCVPQSLSGANLTENAAKLCLLNGVDKFYLRYVLNSQNASEQFQDKMTSSGQPKLALFRIKSCTFPLPALAEQKIITEKLDTLLAQVEATKARLENTLETLKQFRQSVLAAAVSGKLTEDWRDSSLPQWQKVKLIDVLESKPRNGKSPKGVDYETPYRNLTLSSTTTGKFIENQYKFVELDIDSDSYLWVKNGDILIQRANTIDYVGVSAIYEGEDDKYVYPDLIMKCRPNESALGKYLHLALSSEKVRKYFRDNATGTAGNMPKINQQVVSNAPISLPMLAEQHEIVSRVARLFAGADATEQQVNQALERVNNLTQSILAKAFRGELTEQWRKENPELISGDNSSEALLKKIKAERAAAKPKRKARTTSA